MARSAWQVRGASLIWSSYDGAWQKHVTREILYAPRGLAVDPTDGSVAIVEFDTFARGCDPLARGGFGAVSCAERNLGRISRVSCAWRADTTVDGEPPAPFQCCCVEPGPNHFGCSLTCPPPAVPPPEAPPAPPQTPPLPPGYERVNVSAATPPLPVRDYTRLVVDDETLLFAGGYVTTDTQAVSWGDPTTVALVSAARRAPPPPPGQWPAPLSGELFYGKCSAGCGRPTGVDECVACAPGSYGGGSGLCQLCPPGSAGNVSRAASAAEACSPCAPGTYTSVYGSTHCRICPAGAFCADGFALTQYGILTAVPLTGGIALPVLCPVGSYNPREGASDPTACLQCPAGTANAQTGSASNASCHLCEPGSASGVQASHCRPCRPSTAQPRYGAPECDECAPGTYSDRDGLVECRSCPLGSHGPQHGMVHPQCDACPPGTFGAALGAVSCTPCPNGTASAATRAVNNATCAQCVGGYSLFAGAAECTRCPNSTSELIYTIGGRSAGPRVLPQLPEMVIELCAEEMGSPAARRAASARSTALLAAAGVAVVLASRGAAERRTV